MSFNPKIIATCTEVKYKKNDSQAASINFNFFFCF